MDILLEKIKLSLLTFSNNDINELNNRLSEDALHLTFNSFLKIKNNDYTYIIDNLKSKFENDIDHNQHILDAKISELKSVQNKLDIIYDEFNTYKLNIDKIIQDEVNKKTQYKSKYYEDHIENIEMKKKKEIDDKIQYIENSYKAQIEILQKELDKAQHTTISQEHLQYLKNDIIKSITEKNDIQNQASNIKGQFGENIINNIKDKYNLSQNFYLEDTTQIEANGDFIAHNIYPNIPDIILIESKFVKNICTSKNPKHGKSDLVRFEEHYTKFFKENPNSHSIIFSMNSDKISGKGSYHIENIDNHLVFYVSINYSKINNLDIFQDIINFIFHTIVIHIVEHSQEKTPIDHISNNTAILIKTLEKSYIKQKNTIDILENKVYRLHKDIQDFNDLITEHKTNIREIITTFNKINHNFELINIDKPITNMSNIHKFITENNHTIDFLHKTSREELKTYFPNLPSKFTKKKLIDDYNTFISTIPNK
tara:strand:+ start:536 stop:1984 length:1449 start_codon:yes stop_codon:yes gene_type:complete